jgi:DNA-binding PadR family transcriptional regulator
LTETTFLILISTFSPNHGYSIAQEITEMTDGRVKLGPGTLHGALESMESKGWIELLTPKDYFERTKKYVITDLGREVARREYERLAQMVELAGKAMKE